MTSGDVPYGTKCIFDIQCTSGRIGLLRETNTKVPTLKLGTHFKPPLCMCGRAHTKEEKGA